jgi:hypothetical protein
VLKGTVYRHTGLMLDIPQFLPAGTAGDLRSCYDLDFC